MIDEKKGFRLCPNAQGTLDIDFSSYFKDLYAKSYKELSSEEEIELVSRAQNGDKEAFDNMICYNLKLIFKIANKYNFLADEDDLIQEGAIGIIRAVMNFDIEKENKFSTYAVVCIRRRMLDLIQETYGDLYYGRGRVSKLFQLRKIMKTHSGLSKEKLKELAMQEMKIAAVTFDKLYLDLQMQCVSLDEPFKSKKTENSVGLRETIADNALSPEEQVVQEMSAQELKEAVDKYLTAKQRLYVILHYGLSDGEPMGYQEIAEKYGMSRQAVHSAVGLGCERLLERYFKYKRPDDI